MGTAACGVGQRDREETGIGTLGILGREDRGVVGDLDLWCDAMRCGCNVKQEGDHRKCPGVGRGAKTSSLTWTTTTAPHNGASQESTLCMPGYMAGGQQSHERV